jgi:hypothetical protein
MSINKAKWYVTSDNTDFGDRSVTTYENLETVAEAFV